MKLGVNVDHVATIRQARYATMLDSPMAEPSPLKAAWEAVAGGADSITLHLRADRRHIQDADVWAVRREVDVPLNLEMGNTPEILAIALQVVPDYICLVPESREEITTEGGLDALGQAEELRATIDELQAAGCQISLFLDPDPAQVECAASLGVEMIELHTGEFANASGDSRTGEIERLVAASELGKQAGLKINAGHGLTTNNVREIFAIPHLHELNIGHHLVSRSVEIGLRAAVGEMAALLTEYPSDK